MTTKLTTYLLCSGGFRGRQASVVSMSLQSLVKYSTGETGPEQGHEFRSRCLILTTPHSIQSEEETLSPAFDLDLLAAAHFP